MIAFLNHLLMPATQMTSTVRTAWCLPPCRVIWEGTIIKLAAPAPIPMGPDSRLDRCRLTTLARRF